MPHCMWLERDSTGRPRCEHGWATKAGARWRCTLKSHQANARYERSPKGRAAKQRANATEPARTRKALYDLTRIRMGG